MENIQELYQKESRDQVDLLIQAFHEDIASEKKTDILMSIDAKWESEIKSKRKTYEFRKYNVGQDLKRIWFYFNSPLSQLLFVVEISEIISFDKGERTIGEGIGNLEFNNGEKVSKFAYKINHLYELKTPISLGELRDLGVYPPQKYSYLFQYSLLVKRLRSVNFERIY
jgi:predicted transcriptional regulator